MSLETSLSELEELLTAERKAIRSCDVDAVLAAAERKEAILEEIKAATAIAGVDRRGAKRRQRDLPIDVCRGLRVAFVR